MNDLGQWWSELGDESGRTDRPSPYRSLANGIMQPMQRVDATDTRFQALPFGVWTKLAYWDGYARSVNPPGVTVELRDDGTLRFYGPVELLKELPSEVTP